MWDAQDREVIRSLSIRDALLLTIVLVIIIAIAHRFKFVHARPLPNTSARRIVVTSLKGCWTPLDYHHSSTKLAVANAHSDEGSPDVAALHGSAAAVGMRICRELKHHDGTF